MHPNGAIPAYEWAFSDVNPPVHAWAALRVFRIDGSRDTLFLERIFQKLLLSFSWWTNRKDDDGNFLFAGRLPRPGQHRPVRPLGAAAGGGTAASRPTAPAGWRSSASTCWRSRWSSPRRTPPTRTWLIKFFTHFMLIALGDRRAGPLGRGGRVLLRPPAAATSDGRDPAGAGAVHDRAHPALRRRRRARRGARRSGLAARSSRRCGSGRTSPGCVHLPPSATGGLLSVLDEDAAAAGARPGARRVGVPLPARAAGAVGGVPRPSVRPRRSTAACWRPSTTSRRNPRPACSAGTRTGAARSGSPSTSS